MRPSPATWPLKNQLTISSDMIRWKDYLPSLKMYFIHWIKSNFSYETKSSNLTSKKSTDHIQWYDQVKRLSAVFENLFYTLNKSNFSYETKSSNLTSKKSTDHIQWYDQVKRLSAVFENVFYTLNEIKFFLWDQVQQLDL